MEELQDSVEQEERIMRRLQRHIGPMERVVGREESITQHFSFAKIAWKIRNISLALCPLQMAINSDEFQVSGLVETVWRLTLVISHEQKTVTVYLKMIDPDVNFRSPDGKSTGLKVNWKSNFADFMGEQASTSEFTFLFNYRDTIAVQTLSLSDLLRNLSNSGIDDLNLNCGIIITHGAIRNIPVDVSDGVIELSNALVELPTQPLFPDVTIAIGRSRLFLHKAMLPSECEINRLIFDQSSSKLNLLNYDYHSLESIFRYVYSGNLIYVISVPRISIYEDIRRMHISELLSLYPEEKIPLVTNLEARLCIASWRIEESEFDEDSLSGPIVSEYGLVWQIRMHSKIKLDSNTQEKYVFFEVSLLWSNAQNIDVNVEFSSLDKENTPIYSRRDHKRMNVNDKLELPFFVNGGTVMRNCLIDKHLLLQIKLWIYTGNTDLTVGQVEAPVYSSLNNTITLNLFSRKVVKIFHSVAGSVPYPYHGNLHQVLPNSDMFFVSGNYALPTHKFVLGSRSLYIKDKLTAYGVTFTIPNFDRHFVFVFVEHLYSGLLSDVEFPAKCHMYQFGFMFEVEHLINLSRREMNRENVLDILEYAVNNNLMELKSAAFRLIGEIGEDITEHTDWKDLMTRKLSLATAIYDYLMNEHI